MRAAIIIACLAMPAFGLLYQIDQPVPISLAHAEYWGEARLWGSGGILVRFAVGLFDRVTLGMSYGGNGIIGTDSVRFFDRYRPDFQARLALLLEKGYVPNLSLGFESQGYDDCRNKKFAVREKGAYLCAGKTIDASRTYIELGANYWQGFDGFVAVNQLLPGGIEVVAEYDPAFNDGTDRGRGFLNVGLAWTFAGKVRLGFSLRDILGNKPQTELNRTFSISLVDHF
jgi:hypothetical protein